MSYERQNNAFIFNLEYSVEDLSAAIIDVCDIIVEALLMEKKFCKRYLKDLNSDGLLSLNSVEEIKISVYREEAQIQRIIEEVLAAKEGF
jgi:hypothetical protein